MFYYNGFKFYLGAFFSIFRGVIVFNDGRPRCVGCTYLMKLETRVGSTSTVGYEPIKAISTRRAVPDLVLKTDNVLLGLPEVPPVPGVFPPNFRTLITGEVVAHHTSNVEVVKHLGRVLFLATDVAGSLLLGQPFLVHHVVLKFLALDGIANGLLHFCRFEGDEIFK